MKKIVMGILGPPGSGKGTQAEKIAKLYNLEHIIVGDLVRAKRLEKTAPGRQIKQRYDRGIPQPDTIINQLVQNEIKKKSHMAGGYILDPYPISLGQSQGLLNLVKQFQLSKPIILYFKVSQKSVLKRLLLRGKIQKRSDDRLEIIKARFQEYFRRLKDVKNFLKGRLTSKTKVIWLEIDGEPAIDEVSKNVSAKLDKIFKDE